MNKKIILLFIVILIILCIATYIIYTRINSNKKSKSQIEQQAELSESSNEKLKELNGCLYKHFKPIFKEENSCITYDYTQDMEYKDKIYHKLILSYSEYLIYKARWNDICNMDEKDFENSFMVITAVENTSMLGLDIMDINKDENTLYIDLDESKENYDNNETCMSIIIPNSFKSENTEVRDLRKIRETPEYIYGWKNESTEGMTIISKDVAIKIAKEYASSLVDSESLQGKWLEKYTKVYDVTLTQKAPNNYWIIKNGILERQFLVANYERKVYEVILVPYDDEVEMERAYFYVDAYTGEVIGGMEQSD